MMEKSKTVLTRQHVEVTFFLMMWIDVEAKLLVIPQCHFAKSSSFLWKITSHKTGCL